MSTNTSNYLISNYIISLTHAAVVASRTLSGTESRVVLSLEAEGREEFTIEEIEDRAHISRPFARKIAHQLMRKGWVQRLKRGHYLLNPARHGPDALPDTDPFRAGSYLVAPYYFGFSSAAELWGFLPQASRVYYLATPSHHRLRRMRPVEIRTVRVGKERFFGARVLTRRGVRFLVSDAEKTVLDCFLRPELAGGMAGCVQILAAAKAHLDWARLGRYLRRIGERSVSHRVGYLLERVRPDIRVPPRTIADLLPTPREPYVPLGPPRVFGRRGRHDPRWKVVENVPSRELFGEVDLR